MLSEFIYSFIFVVFLSNYILFFTKSLRKDYEDIYYLNKGIYEYFKHTKCINKLKCSENKILYKNLKVNIKNYNKKSVFKGVQDEFINKIYKNLEEKNIIISKQ